MSKIKICGLKRLKDIEYANSIHPDYVGFVFWDKSKRNVSFELAREMRDNLNPDIQSVGVFVDRDIDDIVYLVNEGIISCVQLHGKEDDSTIESIRNKINKNATIIKAFEVKDKSDVIIANESVADMVLIDSGKGSGIAFDWTILSEINRDYFLAGGLSIDNVAKAVTELDPYAVDVSSNVETDGFKDFDKMKSFCKSVREAHMRS